MLIQLAASSAVVRHRVVTFRSGLTATGHLRLAGVRARRAGRADEESSRRVMAVMTNGGSRENVIAERLNHLFETVYPPYTPREVADAINAQAGVKIISAAYLSRLQAGQRAEPSDSRLVAIARFFGVDIGYLSIKAADRKADRTALLSSLPDADVRSIAVRTQGLSPVSLAAVRAVIEDARRLEGLPIEDGA